MNDAALMEYFTLNQGWFEVNHFLSDGLRYLGFGIIKLLYAFAQGCNSLYDKTFTLLDFTKWAGIDQFIEENKLAIGAILTISLFFMGIMLMFTQQKQKNILATLLIAFISITSTGYVMNEINGFLVVGKNAILGQAGEEISLANQIVKGYVYDLLYIDSKVGIASFRQQDGKALSSYHLSEEAIASFMQSPTGEILQTIDPKLEGLSADSQAIFSHKRQASPKYRYGGIPEWEIKPLKEGSFIGGFGKEEYYQYHIEMQPLTISLIALGLIFIFVSYKAFKIIYELVISKILLTFYAADLNGGEITLKILDSIKNGYIILLLTAVLLKVYTIGVSAITAAFASDAWISAIFLIFLSLATIDAPNLVAKITGIDLGVNNEKMALLGMLMMGGKILGMFSSKNKKSHSSSRGNQRHIQDKDSSYLQTEGSKDSLFEMESSIGNGKEASSRLDQGVRENHKASSQNLGSHHESFQNQSGYMETFKGEIDHQANDSFSEPSTPSGQEGTSLEGNDPFSVTPDSHLAHMEEALAKDSLGKGEGLYRQDIATSPRDIPGQRGLAEVERSYLKDEDGYPRD